MLSMTGFGNAEVQKGILTLAVELRSVNHRFLDVALRLPSLVAPFEIDVRQYLKDNLARGRVTVSVTTQVAQDPATATLDADRLARAVSLLRQAAAGVEKATGKPQDITLDHLMAVPDLLKAEEVELSAEEIKSVLMEGLAGAVAGLKKMKTNEGAALVTEMRQRLDNLEAHLGSVNAFVPKVAEEIQQRLLERLAKLLDEPLDPQRLAQEVALLADKANINEECERLAIHIGSYRQALDEGGQVAKRLNFLLQEMHREVNTMGSKSNLMDITQLVIVMKDEVESLREQIQNLE